MQQSLLYQYNEISQFLRDYSYCWQHEILQDYPHSVSRLPSEWLSAVAKLGPDQLWQMDAKLDFSAIDNRELRQCLIDLEQITQVAPHNISVDPHSYDLAAAYFNVREKKRHEIESLAPVLKNLSHELQIKRVIDIGGGQGHFGRVLASHFGVETVSLDRDAALQELGKKNLMRLSHREPAPGAANLTFELCELNEQSSTPTCFSSDSFVVGLHTCGDLAWHLMQHSHKANCKGLLSFGCCYSKMNLDKNGYAINGPKDLPLNQHALTLATRGHKSDSRKSFDLKLRVKRHRYSLHLFHYHNRDIKRFIPMGETVPREYQGAFSDYALPRLLAHGIEATAQELDDFYEQAWVKEQFNQMLYANLIRWQFGRALELLILIDRCLKLEKMGFKTELATYFNERKSPRNIGILART